MIAGGSEAVQGGDQGERRRCPRDGSEAHHVPQAGPGDRRPARAPQRLQVITHTQSLPNIPPLNCALTRLSFIATQVPG